jgi:glyoxylase-like metal-dependent hydrolase (beta-lactamase superfamily II)
MNKVTDPLTNQLIAYTITGLFGNADRTIWMDGRPHPSPNAEHTWDGFSTGEWVNGNALKVTTTHMKAAFINRNGPPASTKSTMTEFFFRHDLHLLLVTIIDDPVYLEEPFVRTSNFIWSPTNNPAPLIPFEIVDEVAGMPEGWVPSYPMGTRHEDFARRFNLPFEATRGGAETMYPEYARRMRTDPRVTPRAQPPVSPNTPPALPAPHAPELLKVQGNVYMLAADGVNVVVQVGEQGVFVVDTGRAGMTEPLLAAIRALTTKPIRYIANTSADADHMGGNAEVSRAGLNLAAINAPGNSGIPSSAAPIVAHEAVLNRVSAPTGEAAPLPFAAWPSSTYFGAKKTMALNGEGIEFIHVPSAHTDGDTMVYFRGSDVVAAGDLWSTMSYPVIDRARGGTVRGVLNALNRIIDLTIPRFNQQGGTRVIPGHGRFGNESDVVEYRDMVTIVRDRIQLMAQKGMTLEQVKAARPTLDYDGVYGTPDRFIEAVYAEVGKGR